MTFAHWSTTIVKQKEEKLCETREEFDYPMKLSAILDLELLAQEIAEGYISR